MDRNDFQHHLDIFQEHGEAGIDLVPSDEKMFYQILLMRYYTALDNTTSLVFDMFMGAYEAGVYDKEFISEWLKVNFTNNKGTETFVKAFLNGDDLPIVGRDLFVETIEYQRKAT